MARMDVRKIFSLGLLDGAQKLICDNSEMYIPDLDSFSSKGIREKILAFNLYWVDLRGETIPESERPYYTPYFLVGRDAIREIHYGLCKKDTNVPVGRLIFISKEDDLEWGSLYKYFT